MKLVYIFLLSLIPQVVFGQISVVSQTVKAVDAGNVFKMAEHFDRVVDVTMNNEQSTYSKAQATAVLQHFFKKNEVSSFTINHENRPNNNAFVYIIGTLRTENGDSFQVYLLFKQKRSGMLLEEIRIEQ